MKREIKARTVLKDIRDGMDDLILMDKYKLTDRGMQSLLKKLVAAELLTQEEVNDRYPTIVTTARIDSNNVASD